MKRAMTLLLALAVLLSLAACAAKQPAAPAEETPAAAADATASDVQTADGDLPYEGVKLTFWWPPYSESDQSYWDTRMQEFTKQTGAVVETTIVPWDELSTKYLSGFMSGEGPDVFYMTNEMMYDMVDAGAVLELSPYFTEEELSTRLYWSAGYALGGQYAAPFSVDTSFRGMAYNLDLLKAAGVTEVPTTWDELIDAACKVKEAGVCEYPVMYEANSAASACLNAFLPTLWSAGGDIVNEDGTQVTMNSDAALRACQYIYDLVHTYGVLSTDCLTVDEQDAADLFVEGKSAITAINSYKLSTMDQSAISFDYTVKLGLSDGTHTAKVFYPIDTLSVNANSKNVEAAVALLKFVTSAETHQDFRNAISPEQVQLQTTEPAIEFDIDWVADGMANLNEHAKVIPIAKGMSSMQDALFVNYQLLLMGELTPEQSEHAMQDACETALTE